MEHLATADVAPPERVFPSRDALLAFVRDFGLARGYAIVTHKSNVPRGQLWLRCDLGAARRRACPFRLYARRQRDAQWLLTVQHAAHNHAAARDAQQLAAHPVARRLSLAQKRLVRELTEAGVRPARILRHLQERHPRQPFKVQDIYNTRSAIRRERLAIRVASAIRNDAPTASSSAPQAAAASSPAPKPVQVAVDENPSDDEVGELPGADTTTREAWRAAQRAFPSWRRDVQLRFARQLQTLVRSCSRESSASPATSATGDGFLAAMAPPDVALELVAGLGDDEPGGDALASAM